ncbi:HEAT repeat domain-containing protein [Brevibacillus formosus]|uniref:hypothetical protein n=1 Tax=Brevibacillus formosus TaxID=54913 RepID=UPI001CA5AFD9|nr:hypothetical protein [Brevibacillus formosus]MBW5468496.1 HEAT repeat domain-containing protein [Brevibacillus formosus]
MITSAEEFVRLRTSENPDEYLRAAWDEAPLDVWHEVIQKYPDMSFWVAQNKTVPIEILKLLAKHPEWRVRSMVASKNKLPEELQVKLAHDPDFSVRKSIAANKKATLKALQILVDEQYDDLRKLVLARIAEGRHK